MSAGVEVRAAMGVDFPTWLAVGGYAGLGCGLLATAAVAGFALRLRRGTRRDLARAILACLVCCCLTLVPIWWTQARFDLLGPTLPVPEVGLWLAWTALAGWTLPLTILAGYALLAAPQPRTGVLPVPDAAGRSAPAVSSPTALASPGRRIEPLGPGRAWGYLVPTEGPFAGRPIPLTLQTTLLGREDDCDIVVPDGSASRHHAELRWDHGRVQLVDHGSLNGTRVNGLGVRGQVPLREGDVVEIGAQRYRLAPARASGPPRAVDGAGNTPHPPSVSGETRKVPGSARSTPTQPPGAATALALVALDGPGAGTRWELKGAVVTLGRDADCDVVLPDLSVSRRHAQVVHQPSGLYLQDLDSQNGTRLNGEPIAAPAPLLAGDVVQVGEVSLRCVAVPAAGGAAESPPAAGAPAPRSISGAPAGHSAPQGGRSQPNGRPTLGPPRLLPTPPPERPR